MRLLAAAAPVVFVVPLLSLPPASASLTCDTPIASVLARSDSAPGTVTCPKPRARKSDSSNLKGKTSRGGARPACVWVREPDYQAGVGQPAEGTGGHWYRKFCHFGAYETLADFQRATLGWDVPDRQQMDMMRRAGLEIRFFTTPPPVPRPTPEQVMASVVDELPFPKTFLSVNPVATKQVIGVPTWVWLTDEKGQFDPERYEQKSKTIEIEGYQLQWQIVPQMTLTPGDAGPDETCTGAGVPWSATAEGDQSACTVTYNKAGKYTLTASVGWTVQWWLAGVQQDDITGPTNTGAQPVTVLEVQTVSR
jgi:hypothetical protein